MHRILIAAVLGLILGLILHRGLGLRFVGVPTRNEPAAPAAPEGPRGPVETQRRQSLHDESIEDLRRKIAAEEQECADLRAKAAAVPKAPRTPTREEKCRNLGRLLTRMMRQVGTKPGPVTPEVQKNLTEFMRLATELGVDVSNASTMFRNPEFTGGVYEGMIDELGLGGDPAVRAEWKSRLTARLQSLGDNPSSMAVAKVAVENTLDFFERFGERLFEKEPTAARTLSGMTAGTVVSMSETPRAIAAGLLLSDVATMTLSDDPTKARLRPIAERWAAEYGAVIAEAAQAHGEKFMASLIDPRNLPASDTEAMAYIRNSLRFKIRAYELEARALDEMATQLTPEQAARLKKLDKVYYFNKISE